MFSLKSVLVGNLPMKIDIKKAFDTLDWKFLLQILRQFRFINTFCDWIQEILHSVNLLILVNGKSYGFFLVLPKEFVKGIHFRCFFFVL